MKTMRRQGTMLSSGMWKSENLSQLPVILVRMDGCGCMWELRTNVDEAGAVEEDFDDVCEYDCIFCAFVESAVPR